MRGNKGVGTNYNGIYYRLVYDSAMSKCVHKINTIIVFAGADKATLILAEG
jgi:hypothetical protein